MKPEPILKFREIINKCFPVNIGGIVTRKIPPFPQFDVSFWWVTYKWPELFSDTSYQPLAVNAGLRAAGTGWALLLQRLPPLNRDRPYTATCVGSTPTSLSHGFSTPDLRFVFLFLRWFWIGLDYEISWFFSNNRVCTCVTHAKKTVKGSTSNCHEPFFPLGSQLYLFSNMLYYLIIYSKK